MYRAIYECVFGGEGGGREREGGDCGMILISELQCVLMSVCILRW